jgi:hypothetical protein
VHPFGRISFQPAREPETKRALQLKTIVSEMRGELQSNKTNPECGVPI